MRLGLLLELVVLCVTIGSRKCSAIHKPVVAAIKAQELGLHKPLQSSKDFLIPKNEDTVRDNGQQHISAGEENIPPRIRRSPDRKCKSKSSTSNGEDEESSEQPPRKGSSIVAWSELPEAEADVLKNADLSQKQYGLLTKNGLRTSEILRLIEAGYEGKELVSLSNLGINFDDMLTLYDAPGITTEEAIVLYDEGLSADEIATVSRSGIEVRDFIPLVMKGYRAEQLLTLVNSGWTSSQIHSLVEMDASPFHVLNYVKQGIPADEILSFLN